MNHFVAANVANINVNIGQGNTFGVEKAFKQQIVFERVKFGNAKQIGDKTARRRTSARTDGNFFSPRKVNEVVHNQKVAVITHAVNYPKLVIEPRSDFLGDG